MGGRLPVSSRGVATRLMSGESLNTIPALRWDVERRMGDLRVAYDGRAASIRADESLGFGRTNIERGGSVGWGYEGRFIELGPDPAIHRVWGEIVWHHDLWCVRALGRRNPLSVVLPGAPPIELRAHTDDERRDGAPPELLAVTQPRFRVRCSVGAHSFELACSSEVSRWDRPTRGLSGNATIDVGAGVSETITEAEYRVLRTLAREFIDGPSSPESPPRSLSYARVRHALDLQTERQAISAVERLVRRFRDGGLLSPSVGAAEQRDAICDLGVRHGVIDRLDAKYGARR